MEKYHFLVEWIDLLVKLLALLIGALWTQYKFREYREFKNCVQLDINAQVFRLNRPRKLSGRTWNEKGKKEKAPHQCHTHVVEVALKFSNKGKTRVKLYNAQVGINSMREQDQTLFSECDGHLQMKRLFTSGNIVPELFVEGKPIEETSFYYIEPGVEQTITYLCLIPNPGELLQVFSKFSLEQIRLFPEKTIGPKGLYPHTVAKTIPVVVPEK